jgi:3-hydroxyacyl-CoA dehydrogenase
VQPSAPVRIERHADVALIIIDHPPVNALSAALRRELLGAIQTVCGDSSLRAGVIACDGRTFIAGADIREFDAPPGDITTADLCAALDACPKPFVAALHGTALGAGFELALACHARTLAPDGRAGLPEVRIGLIPGAGGTQRTPRLAGALPALEMVTTGRQLGADEALALGLVDEIATDLRRCAIDRARSLADSGQRPRARDRAVPATDRAVFDAAVTAVRKKARGAIAPGRAAEAVGWALDLPFDEACTREKALSLELRQGPQSRALRHIFHAERVAARMPPGPGHDAQPWPVKHAGVVGGGTMGTGIAVALADSGLDVTVIEVSREAALAVEARVGAIWDRHAKSGRLTEGAHAERLSRIRFATDPATLVDSDLVVEAVVEDLVVKQDVFRRLSAIVRRDCVLASNASYLDINLLADVVDAPERVLGLHFFSPAHVMRLVEIVRASRSMPEALATGLAVAKRLGKQPVICGVSDGFVGNRILARWRTQCDFALEDGALPEEVDAAMEAYGFPMGPYAVADLSGLDIGWATRKRQAATREPRARYVPIADWICELGRFGQKTGAGWYRHENGKRFPDVVVAELVIRASAERGLARRSVPPEEIQWRVHAAMVNEAARILAEGVAQRPSDIDVVLVNGYGYPAWRGGPMHEADMIGLPEILRRVEALYGTGGPGWEPAPLLRELVEAGRRFADLNI